MGTFCGKGTAACAAPLPYYAHGLFQITTELVLQFAATDLNKPLNFMGTRYFFSTESKDVCQALDLLTPSASLKCWREKHGAAHLPI